MIRHEVAPGIADKTLDTSLVVAFARPAITIADQVVGQKPAGQRRPLAGAVSQDLRHQAPVVVVDDRLRHGPEEGERTDVATNQASDTAAG